MTLVGYWPLIESSGDVQDYSRSSNNGSTFSGTTQGVTGILSKTAYEFDGSSGRVEVPDSSALRSPADTNEITISAWVNPTYTNMDSKGTVCTKLGVYYSQVASNGEVSVYTYNSGGGGSSYMTTTSTLPENTWSHIVFTETNGQRDIYINGAIDTTGSFTSSIGINNSGQNLGIGGEDDGDRYFDGKISEVRLYNRALTAQEVQYLHNVVAGQGEWYSDWRDL